MSRSFLLNVLHFLAFVICSLVSLSSLCAADSLSTQRTYFQTMTDDLRIVGEDAVSYFTAPLHFSSPDILFMSGAIGGTLILMPADQWGREQAQAASRSSAFQYFMNASKEYGEITIAGGLLGTTYLGGLLFKDPWLRITGLELAEGLAFAGITTTMLKVIIGRSRPYNNFGSQSYKPFQTKNGHNSLPSGHVTVAFTLSSILSERFRNPFVSCILYGIATCTALSRMYHDEHWLSDTFLGAAIGISTGIFVVHRDDERERSHLGDVSQLTITPTLSGLSLLYKF